MHSAVRTTLASAVALVAVAACASSHQYASNAAAGAVDLAAYPAPELPASELQLLRGMSDQDILGHLVLVDSLEIAAADSTIRISMNQDVLTYARMMRAAHSTDLDAVRRLGKERGITPVQQFGGLRA